jgi:Ni,Fe-hydrogenase III small subunit
MIREIIARYKQGYQTFAYPDKPVAVPERFRGYPELKPAGTEAENIRIAESCAFGALSADSSGLSLDMGTCLFCSDCTAKSAVSFSREHSLAATKREDLIVRSSGPRTMAEPLKPELLKFFKRSLKFREVSAGGCNACEADTNVLSTVGWDLGRFGVQFVASPRHADGLWITGPIPENMREATLQTYEGIPGPKIVVACGACAINGGPFRDSPEVVNGVSGLLPVDLYIPGCPPHPVTILDGILRIIGRI